MEETEAKRIVCLQDFKTLKFIGKGNYAKVVLVRKCDSNRIYALKVIKKTKILERNQKEHVFSEKEILAKCDHPFIVKMASAFHNDKKLFFVLEYCPGGQLFNLLRKKARFSEEMTRFYAAQMVLGLEYLHFNGIVYLDLKPENVLLDKEGYIRLSDFGLSVTDYTKKDKFRIAGSPDYLAPEVLMKAEVGPEVDWWCLGIIIYEMVTGLPPFYEEEQPKEMLLQRIKTENPKWKFSIGKELKDLLAGLLEKDRHKRLGSQGAQSVKDHSWFRDVQWEALLRKEIKAPFVPVLRSEQDVSCFERQFTEFEALSPPELLRKASSGSDPIYKGFSYERSSRSKSGGSGGSGSPSEVSIPSASPSEDIAAEFKMSTKQGDEL